MKFRALRRFLLRLRPEAGIPFLEGSLQTAVEHLGARLEHKVRPLLRPLHLLELGEALAHDLVHHRFHEPVAIVSSFRQNSP